MLHGQEIVKYTTCGIGTPQLTQGDGADDIKTPYFSNEYRLRTDKSSLRPHVKEL